MPFAALPAFPGAEPWLNLLPKPLFSQLIQFEQIWRGNAYFAVQVISQSKAAEAIFLNNIQLFWLIMERCGDWHISELLSLFNLRQKQILGYLDLPEEQAVISFMKKLQLWMPLEEEADAVYQVVSSGSFRHLSHLKSITCDLIHLLRDYPEIAPCKALQKYQPSWETEFFSETLSSLLFDAKTVGLNADWVSRKLKGINPEKEIDGIQNKLENYTINTRLPPKKPNCVYPSPPLEGNEFIAPISKYYDLLSEAKCQQNCVQDFHEEILNGDTFFYQMTFPQRATIQFVRHSDERYCLEDILLKKNKAPSNTTKNAVFDWVELSGLDIDYETYLFNHEDIEDELEIELDDEE